MAQWLPGILTRIRDLASAHKVWFTLKARQELAELEYGLDEQDACDVLANLKFRDCAGRVESAATGEWMYLFKPRIGGTVVYVKLILRSDCVVVSFHADESAGHEESQW
jgi:hypothetical protein